MFQGDRGSPGPLGPQGMKGEGYPGPQVCEGDKDFNANNTENKSSNIYTYDILRGFQGCLGSRVKLDLKDKEFLDQRYWSLCSSQ